MPTKTFRKCSIIGCHNELRVGAFKYCSIKCSHVVQKKKACSQVPAYRIRAEAFLIRGGHYGYVAPHFLARFLRDYYAERCLRCGWSQRHPKTGNVPIEVEHIDGDWENNRLTNLTLLCPNCHALTPTFRGLNRERGRAYRLAGRTNCQRLQTRSKPSIREVFEAQSRQLELLSPT